MSGLFGGGASAAANASNTVGDLKGDMAVAEVPDDSISDISFNTNPTEPKDFLAVASWDKKVRIYEVPQDGKAAGRHIYEHDQPVFSVDWFKVSAIPIAAPFTRPS